VAELLMTAQIFLADFPGGRNF